MSLNDLKSRLEEMGIAPKRALGQNFLVSKTVIAKIIEAVRLRQFKDLIEIGPGIGALTEPLLGSGLTPRLIELDSELAKYWSGRGLTVIEKDALKVDWESLNLQAPALLVSNLPYQISTSLVVDRCFGPEAIQFMVLMFQKEVAERLMAKPRSKEYGLLSVMAQVHFEMTRVSDASPKDFFPAPKVASRVLAFKRLSAPGLGIPFFKFTKGAFAQRRKFLLKNLGAVVDKSKQPAMVQALEALGYSEKARAEELTPQDFAAFYRKIYEH